MLSVICAAHLWNNRGFYCGTLDNQEANTPRLLQLLIELLIGLWSHSFMCPRDASSLSSDYFRPLKFAINLDIPKASLTKPRRCKQHFWLPTLHKLSGQVTADGPQPCNCCTWAQIELKLSCGVPESACWSSTRIEHILQVTKDTYKPDHNGIGLYLNCALVGPESGPLQLSNYNECKESFHWPIRSHSEEKWNIEDL